MNSKLSVRKIEKHEIQILDCDGELKDNENWMSAETSQVRCLRYAQEILNNLWHRQIADTEASFVFASLLVVCSQVMTDHSKTFIVPTSLVFVNSSKNIGWSEHPP